MLRFLVEKIENRGIRLRLTAHRGAVDGFKTTVLCVSELLGEGMKRIQQ